MTPFTFVVPGPIAYELSPNGRTRQRGYLTRLRRDQKDAWTLAIVAARNAIRPFPETPMFAGPVVCEIVYGKPKGAQSMDPDNLIAATKWGRDQLQAEGIIANDRWLDPVVTAQVRDPEGVGFLEITVREITPLETRRTG